VINGGEKALIAQESGARNIVIALKHAEPKASYTAACRSYLEGSNTIPSPITVRVVSGKAGSSKAGCHISAKVSQVQAEINAVIYFRALGIISDMDIMSMIRYDPADEAVSERVRPSLEETFEINSQNLALDFIGKRHQTVGANREKRIEYATEVIHKRFLPHVGVGAEWETNKVHWETIHRLLPPPGLYIYIYSAFPFLFPNPTFINRSNSTQPPKLK
jgi:DNA-directed RNA polymerase II subunit RPB2